MFLTQGLADSKRSVVVSYFVVIVDASGLIYTAVLSFLFIICSSLFTLSFPMKILFLLPLCFK